MQTIIIPTGLVSIPSMSRIWRPPCCGCCRGDHGDHRAPDCANNASQDAVRDAGPASETRTAGRCQQGVPHSAVSRTVHPDKMCRCAHGTYCSNRLQQHGKRGLTNEAMNKLSGARDVLNDVHVPSADGTLGLVRLQGARRAPAPGWQLSRATV
jgi:hypothetical protein